MNRLFLAIFILAACSSCEVYQLTKLSSTMNGTIDEPFTFENDTLILRYSFNRGGLAEIGIFNKSNKPLYLDWTRSGRIITGAAEPYWIPESGENPVLFIPPNSGLNRAPFNVAYIWKPAVIQSKSAESRKYTLEETPLRFRSYFLLSYDQDFAHPFSLDHEFWISDTYQSKQPITPQSKQNTFTTSELTEGGNAAATILGVIIAIPFAALYVYTQD